MYVVMSLLIDERNSSVAVPCCSFSISGIPSLVRFCGGSDPSKGGHLVIHWWSPRYAARESIGVQTGTASRAATATSRHRPWKMLGKTNCSDRIQWWQFARVCRRRERVLHWSPKKDVLICNPSCVPTKWLIISTTIVLKSLMHYCSVPSCALRTSGLAVYPNGGLLGWSFF